MTDEATTGEATKDKVTLLTIGTTTYVLPHDTDLGAIVSTIEDAMNTQSTARIQIPAEDDESGTLLVNGRLLESALVHIGIDPRPGGRPSGK